MPDDLQTRIEEKRLSLLEEERTLDRAREEARREFIRLAGGRKTWKRMQELVMATYAFAGNLTPSWLTSFDEKVLQMILSLEDYDAICRTLDTTPARVDGAVSRIARRMLTMRSMQKEYEAMRAELERVREDNRRILKEYRLQSEMTCGKDGLTSRAESPEISEEARRLLPLKDIRVSSLGLPVRAVRVLSAMSVETLYDLVGLREEILKKVRNCGRKSIEEIKEVLSSRGLSFGMHDALRMGEMERRYHE